MLIMNRKSLLFVLESGKRMFKDIKDVGYGRHCYTSQAMGVFVVEEQNTELWHTARRLREKYWGNKVFLRGIIEFSNHCRQNCLYCGLRRDNRAVHRYRLDTGTILRCAEQIRALGIGTVVLQSGEDPFYTGDDLARLIEAVKITGLAVTLSLGERDHDEYRLWREAGADRYLLKFETGDCEAYARLRPGRILDERLDALHALSECGYETGTGLIMGLPGETREGLEHDFTLLRNLKPDMVSISPFVPHPATPLAAHPACESGHILNGMARVRLELPTAHMPVTSALGLRGDAMRLMALQVADVIMPSLTPETVREEYMIYPGKNVQSDDPETRARALRSSILAAGYDLPAGPGSAWRLKHGGKA